MIDRRRCLVVALACLGLALLVLSLGCTAARPGTAALTAGDGALIPGGTGGVGADWSVMVYPGDERCSTVGSTDAPPPRERVLACQESTAQALRAAIVARKILLAPEWEAIIAQHPDAWPTFLAEVDRILAQRPYVAWRDRPVWVLGWNGSDPACQPCWICAAGASGWPSITVSLLDRLRVLPLVAWETSNAWFQRFNRPDLYDSSVISSLIGGCR